MVETKLKEPNINALDAMSISQMNVIESCHDQYLLAKWLIQSCTQQSIFLWISGATSVNQAWNLLTSSYKGTYKVKMVILQTLQIQF